MYEAGQTPSHYTGLTQGPLRHLSYRDPHVTFLQGPLFYLFFAASYKVTPVSPDRGTPMSPCTDIGTPMWLLQGPICGLGTAGTPSVAFSAGTPMPPNKGAPTIRGYVQQQYPILLPTLRDRPRGLAAA